MPTNLQQIFPFCGVLLSWPYRGGRATCSCAGAGEAIWDKPHVVAAREAHARALEERYSGLPQPLLLKVG